ncbi:hypothetical protein HPB47_024233 [Ixodes persulcatus]|uniref:Uncharacterized protein n=1 Tax=Ixodes persulcatus TaxID=34615 RepID=A0AC60Q6T1_IXOPE|nr:hypothetical protein HPB47_024233 [Ixodes persulcatus]
MSTVSLRQFSGVHGPRQLATFQAAPRTRPDSGGTSDPSASCAIETDNRSGDCPLFVHGQLADQGPAVPVFLETSSEGPTSPTNQDPCAMDDDEKPAADSRKQWGKGMQFFLSCLSISIGLGNVWRFPTLAYQNGGGIGVAQLFSTFYVTVSYNYIMALCLFYVFASMQSQLPWTHCDPEWSDSNCFDSRAGLLDTFLQPKMNKSSIMLQRGLPLGAENSSGIFRDVVAESP